MQARSSSISAGNPANKASNNSRARSVSHLHSQVQRRRLGPASQQAGKLGALIPHVCRRPKKDCYQPDTLKGFGPQRPDGDRRVSNSRCVRAHPIETGADAY
jgi:hypothetical protein